MAIIIILMCAQWLIVIEGIQYSKSLNPLETFSCLEETKVTFISYRSRSESTIDAVNLLTFLEDLCTNISFFHHKLRKVVQWKGGKSKYELMRIPLRIDNSENTDFAEILESFFHQEFENGSTSKHVLLIDQSNSAEFWTERMKEAIALLQKNIKWNVIFICNLYSINCPEINNLPIHRIVPTTHRYNNTIRIRDLVRNPDFNKFEFLKYVKIHNRNLTCLANKTVHIIVVHINYIELLEVIALIQYNIQEKDNTTQFIIYSAHDEEFFKYLLKRTGLDSYNIIIYNIWSFRRIDFTILKRLPVITENGVYFLNADYAVEVFSIRKHPFNNRNGVVVYELADTENERRKGILGESWINHHSNFSKTVKKYLIKSFNKNIHFYENFLEVLLDASCF